MLPSLYNLAQNYLNIMELMNDESVPAEVIEQALSSIEGDFLAKVVNVARMIRVLEANEKAASDESARLKQNEKIFANRKNNLKQYLLNQMTAIDKKNIVNDGMTVSIRNNPPAVNILDESQIPAQFIEIIQSQKIDKTAIKQAIKLGHEVPGVELVHSKSVSIK